MERRVDVDFLLGERSGGQCHIMIYQVAAEARHTEKGVSSFCPGRVARFGGLVPNDAVESERGYFQHTSPKLDTA